MRGIDASDPRVGYPTLQGERFFKMHLTPFAYRYDPYHNDIPDDSIRNIPPPPPPPANTAGVPDKRPPPPASADDPSSIVVAFMSFSDEAQAAQFGSASIWPEYIYYGNDSKYRRAKPPENCGFHQAYFAKLPDEIFDAYRKAHGCDMPDEVYTHLKRAHPCNLGTHAVRRFYGRKVNADYPEKVLLATIMSMGGCPCPRCFVQKKLIGNTGTDADMRQRQKIRIDDHPRRFTIEDASRYIC
ncbi:hypothetical protein MKEN_01498900 [Mycena kentingensis (nom. inval.)]|nr:hypothetical protein MKEN_01498900 [Mycena kentingensis (nom. inval.)]